MRESEAGTLETRADAGKPPVGTVRLWLDAIDLADKREEAWRKKADEVTERYRDEKERKGYRFNILHTNVSTLAPALYNSTPQPDVRRRFRDADPVGKAGAQMLERGLSFSVDAYDFDGVMQAVVHDSLLVGRGVPRVRYVPVFSPQAAEASQPSQKPQEEVAWEKAECELVDWKDFRVGPGRRWDEVPWVAFRHRLTREQAVSTFGSIAGALELDFIMDGAEKQDAREVADTFKRLTVWEIWDKERREIVFIAPCYKDGPLKTEKDTLGLESFFPCPRPLYDVDDPNSLTPLVPYSFYQDQAEELDRLTARITALVKVIKWRGISASDQATLTRLGEARDGDLVPVENYHEILANGGFDKSVWLWPIETAVKVLEQLYIARDQVKQVIFEITGVADIMRGQTDPNETLGAQQLKTQWGSLRLQKRQKEVQRLARDLMRMKAEIMAEKFSPQTLMMMTGVQLPTQAQKQQAQQMLAQLQQQAQMGGQAPQVPPEIEQVLKTPSLEEVMQLIKTDATRGYRIDIETDSTIQADQMQAQKNMGEFVQGTTGFMQAFGEAVLNGQVPPDVVVDLYTGFARNFKLGKQAEDALDRWAEMAQQASQQPKPPTPEEVKMQAEQQKMQMEGERDQQKHQLEMQRMEAEAAREKESAELEMAMKREEADIKRQQMRTQMMVERNKAISTVVQSKAKADGAVASEEAKRETERIKQGQMTGEIPKPQAGGSGDVAEGDDVPDFEAIITGMAQQGQQTAQAVEQIAQAVAQLVPAVSELVQRAKAPKTLIRRGGRMVAAKIGEEVRPINYGSDGSITVQ
jgi:hypothetical protein